MYFDLDDHRPDTPRVPDVISRREGVLLSLVVHGALALLLIFPPFEFAKSKTQAVALEQRDPVRFVQMMPRVERPAIAARPPEASDADRRASSPERSKAPENTLPASRGNTTERVAGGKTEDKPAGAEAPQPGPVTAAGAPTAAAATPVPVPAADLRGSLRNLKRYLDDQNFDNQKGQSEQDPDIQFDSKGVDFGPWLRRFVSQVKRNWLIPMNAMSQSGRVVITFNVMRDGTIRDLQIIGPSPIGSFNTAAFNALRMSNPTVPLPAEYPADKAFFTVTFHYNDGVRLP